MKISEKVGSFGIKVIQRLRPTKGSYGIKRLGILALGIGLLLGVSQAGTIGRLIAGSADSSASVAKLSSTNAVSLNTATTAASTEDSTTDDKLSGAPNIVDLLAESDVIVRGNVTGLSDGFENGVPYTEVTMQVTESLRGGTGESFTFRQFGLLAPKKMSNGKVNISVTPAGWAKYQEGEEAILFVGQQASLTGLRTTVGLGQGKIAFKGGNAESQYGNVGLFENVDVDAKLVNDSDKRVLATQKGAVNKESFLSFVRKAVNGKWVEGGKLRHAKK
jgi:hypothetical protein